jgi:hypothetical protein
VGQALPQPPQLAVSVSVLTQVSPHATKPVSHTTPHVLFSHTAVPFAGALHLVPQAPQFEGSDSTWTQAPLHSS